MAPTRLRLHPSVLASHTAPAPPVLRDTGMLPLKPTLTPLGLELAPQRKTRLKGYRFPKGSSYPPA